MSEQKCERRMSLRTRVPTLYSGRVKHCTLVRTRDTGFTHCLVGITGFLKPLCGSYYAKGRQRVRPLSTYRRVKSQKSTRHADFFWATKLWTEHRGNGRRGQKNEMRCTRRTEYSAIRCPINRRSFL